MKGKFKIKTAYEIYPKKTTYQVLNYRNQSLAECKTRAMALRVVRGFELEYQENNGA